MIRRLPHRGCLRFRRGDAARFLLVVGTPGTGKRSLGHYLAERSGYIHLDFENRRIRRWVLDSGAGVLRAALRVCRREHRGVVITWNAGAERQLEHLEWLRRLGFECLWFDADAGASGRAYLGAAGSRARRFRFVEAFESDGRFRPLEHVVCAALERPRRAPRLAPALAAIGARIALGPGAIGRRIRTPVAVGVALAAAVAGASIAALVAVPWSSQVASQGLAPSRGAPATGVVAASTRGALPRRGELVYGRSLAGVALGDTMATVRRLWGHQYVRCSGCKPEQWFYFQPGGTAGAGVEFERGKVVAVYTLGSDFGWGSDTGLKIGELLPMPKIAVKSDRPHWEMCSGYGAKSSAPTHGTVTSILTQGPAVYGFELSRPSLSPCQ